jgi:biotin carboxylase
MPTGWVTMSRVLIVGSGHREFRRYLFEGMPRDWDVVLLDDGPVTWQADFVDDYRTVDLSDDEAVVGALKQMCGCQLDGILTWDERLLIRTADIGKLIGIKAISPEAAQACRDKGLQRELLAAARVPSARFHTASSIADAVQAAHRIGYPVVVKPIAMAGSIAVELVANDDQLRRAATRAVNATRPGFPRSRTCLVEEYLKGPEISVDSWVIDNEIVPFLTAHKRKSDPPFFEELGHTVGLRLDTAVDHEVADVVRSANRALGVDRAVTHTELILTDQGPKVVEVNGRIGGDLIPYLGELAYGVRAGHIVVATALGHRPDTTPSKHQLAAVRFLYPAHDVVFADVVVDEGLAEAPWLHRLTRLAMPGSELLLPPRGHLTRAAAAVITADDEPSLNARLNKLQRGLRISGVPINREDV